MHRFGFLLVLLLVLVLAGCGGDASPAASPGDAAEGEKVYADVAAPACSTCHSLEPGVTMVGPSLSGVGAAAGSRVSGMSAVDYLAQSVREPDAHVVEGFAPGIMSSAYGAQLTEQQLNDLVAYLQTLK
ncbi:c-type cytochrome [Chloroflexota bacterium]